MNSQAPGYPLAEQDEEPPTALCWDRLKTLTSARIGLPRSGASIGMSEVLQFRMAHARAKDAIALPLDRERMRSELETLGMHVLLAESAAVDRTSYLLRPDLGRQLDSASQSRLAESRDLTPPELAIVIADGLSAVAVQNNAIPLLKPLVQRMRELAISCGPVVLLRNGRVAAGDPIANALSARGVLVLIGERPGLSSSDSLSAYFTWQPTARSSDADRNCISNIRTGGLPPDQAARKLAYLIEAARASGRSGVALKDNMAVDALAVWS